MHRKLQIMAPSEIRRYSVFHLDFAREISPFRTDEEQNSLGQQLNFARETFVAIFQRNRRMS